MEDKKAYGNEIPGDLSIAEVIKVQEIVVVRVDIAGVCKVGDCPCGEPYSCDVEDNGNCAQSELPSPCTIVLVDLCVRDWHSQLKGSLEMIIRLRSDDIAWFNGREATRTLLAHAKKRMAAPGGAA